MVENIAYPILIASHIKPWRKSTEIEAYDPSNGFMWLAISIGYAIFSTMHLISLNSLHDSFFNSSLNIVCK